MARALHLIDWFVPLALIFPSTVFALPNAVWLQPTQPDQCVDATIPLNQTYEIQIDFEKLDIVAYAGAWNVPGARWTISLMNPGYQLDSHSDASFTPEFVTQDPPPDPVDLTESSSEYGSVVISGTSMVYTVGGSSQFGQLSVGMTCGTNGSLSCFDPGTYTAVNVSVVGTYGCTTTPVTSNCANNTLELNQDGWQEWKVDQFWHDYVKNHTHYAEADATTWKPMVQLGNDFNIGNKANCVYDTICQPQLFECDQVTPNNDGPYDTQVYMVYLSLMNLSDLIYTLWFGANKAAWDTNEIGDTLISIFEPPASSSRSWWQIAGQTSAIMSMAMSFINIIPGASVFTSVPGAIATVLGGLGAATGAAFDPALNLQVQYDKEFGQNLALIQNQTTSALIAYHDALFDHDQGNITSVLYNGTFVDRSVLGIDDDEAVTESLASLQQFVQLRLIADMWKENNVFIVYMPYTDAPGANYTQVAWPEGDNDAGLDLRVLRAFTQADCENQFLKDNGDRVLCDTSGLGLSWLKPGMFRLTYLNTNNGGNIDFSSRAPGWNKNYNITATGYTFNGMHALIGSIKSHDFGGFGFDGPTWIMNTLNGISDSDVAIGELANMSPDSPLIWNFPICTSLDMSSFPSSEKGANTLSGLCSCNLDNSVDMWGNKFRDNVNPAIKKYVEKTGTDSGINGCFAWNGDPGRNDFTDIRNQWTGPCNESCYPVWPPAGDYYG